MNSVYVSSTASRSCGLIIWKTRSGIRKIRIQMENVLERRDHRPPGLLLPSRSGIRQPFAATARLEARNERQISVLLTMIEAVADEELAGRVESDPARLLDQLRRNAL